MNKTPSESADRKRNRWDTDKALQSTFTGRFTGKYQLRMFALTCIVFSTAESWISGFVYFNECILSNTTGPVFCIMGFICEIHTSTLLHLIVYNTLLSNWKNSAIPPRSLACFNFTNMSAEVIQEIMAVDGGNRTWFNDSDPINGDDEPDWSQQGVLTPIQVFRDFNVSANEDKNIHIEFGLLCGEEHKILYSRIGYIFSKHFGALLCGHLADRVGRKVTFIGASIVCYVMVLFQVLSEDFVSYCFFMIFIGLSSGGIIVSGITMIVETFPISSRSMFSMALLICSLIFDLVIPWLAKLIGWWKLLQSLCGLPLLLSILLYWWSEETVYFYVSSRLYFDAIQSLTKIARFNSVNFQSRFTEANDFIKGRHSKGVQCDFQPLIRLREIPKLKKKYPTFNFADMLDPNLSSKQTSGLSWFWDIVDGLRGKHFHRNSSHFRATDYFQSGIVGLYILLVCALWFVNGVTFSSLESHELSWRLKKNHFWGYCFQSLTAVFAAIAIFPIVYKVGRRWPTFCLYLVGEVCLLASIVAKIEREFTSITLSLIYLIGKSSTYGAYMVLAMFTTEVFPTGLRATSLGLGLLFRSVGIIIADPDLLNFHDWTSRLIYGFLSLLIGSLALFLPEVKQYPLSRTFNQVETIPSAISRRIRQMRMSSKQKRRMKQQASHLQTTVSRNPQSLLNNATSVGPNRVRFLSSTSSTGQAIRSNGSTYVPPTSVMVVEEANRIINWDSKKMTSDAESAGSYTSDESPVAQQVTPSCQLNSHSIEPPTSSACPQSSDTESKKAQG